MEPLLITLVYLAVVLVVGLWAWKKETPNQFLIAGRKAGVFTPDTAVLTLPAAIIGLLLGQLIFK